MCKCRENIVIWGNHLDVSGKKNQNSPASTSEEKTTFDPFFGANLEHEKKSNYSVAPPVRLAAHPSHLLPSYSSILPSFTIAFPIQFLITHLKLLVLFSVVFQNLLNFFFSEPSNVLFLFDFVSLFSFYFESHSNNIFFLTIIM